MLFASCIQLTDHLKSLYIKTANKLTGTDRRQFMAEVVKGLGLGGQTFVEKELRFTGIQLAISILSTEEPKL